MSAGANQAGGPQPSRFESTLWIPTPEWYVVLVLAVFAFLHLIIAFAIFWFIAVKPVCVAPDGRSLKWLQKAERSGRRIAFVEDVEDEETKQKQLEDAQAKKGGGKKKKGEASKSEAVQAAVESRNSPS